MKQGSLRSSAYAVLTAFIWGTAFVAQSVGAEHVPPLAFNAARSVIAFVFLLVLCAVMRSGRRRKGQAASVTRSRKDLLLGGFWCGLTLGLASFLQQKGLDTTSPGKAGFITALYIVLVPIFGIFLKKRVPKAVWVSVLLAVTGLYCLCITESFTIAPGDLCVMLCAFVFTAQILLVDHFVTVVDGVELSCCQFFFVTAFSLIGSLLFEHSTWTGLTMAAGAILYAGLLSSGVGYTLQILAQKGSNPTVISLLLSLESVFATISGAAGGCQYEIGTASAMAAAALCYLGGGDAEAICHAAALAIKSLLGLVCDPIAGLVEVPCIKRNASGAMVAMCCADMALAGIRSAVPPDEVIMAMKDVGDKMDVSLRETGLGGIAGTPSGVKIADELRLAYGHLNG